MRNSIASIRILLVNISNLDRIDHKILHELQIDSSLPNSELANRVGLSDSPCLRRVRKLEELGYIKGYHAHLDEVKSGTAFNLFVGIKVRRHGDDQTGPFENWARSRPEIAACYLVSGEIDYLLHVVVADVGAYEQFLSNELLTHPSIQDIRSNMAVRVVKPPFGVRANLLD